MGDRRFPPPEWVEYLLMEKFGWTPDQISAMDTHKIDTTIAVMVGQAAAAEYRAWQLKPKQ